MKEPGLPACAVLLAGGRGTRFWPRSRTRTPKQLLNIVGQKTMLGDTADRLAPLVAPRNIWVVTNRQQAAAVGKQLPKAPAAQIIAEPIGRNTAAAIGLAAIHLAKKHGDALMAVLPSDAHIQDLAAYRRIVRVALQQASRPGRMIVIGIEPTRAETGYGYIERGAGLGWSGRTRAFVVRRFTEKPDSETAKQYVASGRYFWNAGMFFWRVSTFLENLKRFLPATHTALLELANTIGTKRYAAALARIYAKLENISVDYAIMERATRDDSQRDVLVIPANFGWSDVGSWAAVYELLAARPGANVPAQNSFALDANGNFVYAPAKFVAAIGVNDLVVVDTSDALLICSRARSQDVGRVVKFLEERNKRELL